MKKQLIELVSKSVLAAILIGLGVAVSLTMGQPLGAIFFAFGLLGVCVLKVNLFTGKAGYWWKEKSLELSLVLGVNLIIGYLIGVLISIANPVLIPIALAKVMSWQFTSSFFIQAIFCGMVMYLCVEMFRNDEKTGIFLGVPLFIFCGFQHCIANIIIMGVAHSFSWTILLAIAGNLLGSIIINLLQNIN